MLGVILAAAYSILFIFLIKRMSFFSIDGITKKWLMGVFIFKLLAGTCLWFIYTYYYPKRTVADIFKYFDDGLIMYNTLYTKPMDFLKMFFGVNDDAFIITYYSAMKFWLLQYDTGLYNENTTLIRFNALCDIFSFGNYHVHTVFICFLSLTGLTGIYKSFSPYLPDKRIGLFIIVFLVPSILFWSSAVLKEGLVFFALGMCLFYYFKLVKNKFSSAVLVGFIFFFFLLSISKLYVSLVITPAFITHAIITKTNYRWPELKYILVFSILFVLAYNVPNYHLPSMIADKKSQAISLARGGSYICNTIVNKYVLIDSKYENRITYLKGYPDYCRIVPGVSYYYWQKESPDKKTFVENSKDTLTYYVFFDHPPAGSYINIPDLNGTYLSMIKNAPVAFINTAFRPTIFEANSFLMFISAIENLIIIAFMLICIFFASRKIEHKHLIYFCLCGTVLLFVLIGLTTPILGSVVRYRTPMLPFLLIPFLLIIDKERLIKALPFTRKMLG